jgi:hypothetical protein
MRWMPWPVLLRIPLPRTRVNRGKRKDRGCLEPGPTPCERLRSDRYARITNV